MNGKQFTDWLKERGACQSGIDWVDGRSLYQVWRSFGSKSAGIELDEQVGYINWLINEMLGSRECMSVYRRAGNAGGIKDLEVGSFCSEEGDLAYIESIKEQCELVDWE